MYGAFPHLMPKWSWREPDNCNTNARANFRLEPAAKSHPVSRKSTHDVETGTP